MRKLNKAQARKSFDRGETVYIIAHKMMPFTPWGMEYPTRRENETTQELSFDDIVQSYEWYNCTYETGYYAAYYQR